MSEETSEQRAERVRAMADVLASHFDIMSRPKAPTEEDIVKRGQEILAELQKSADERGVSLAEMTAVAFAQVTTTIEYLAERVCYLESRLR